MFIPRYLTFKDSIKSIAIVGGTHGNEANGVFVARHLMANPLSSATNIHINALLNNIEAIKQNKRYIDQDLNRCFHTMVLNEASTSSAPDNEQLRSLQINELLGPKTSLTPKTDLLIDLHNTTANAGIMICGHPDDLFVGALVAYLRKTMQDQDAELVNLVLHKAEETPFVPTVARSGLTLEVGPCAWGVVDMHWALLTFKCIIHIVEFCDAVNRHNASVPVELLASSPCPLFHHEPYYAMRRLGTIDYPRYEDQVDLNGIPLLKAGIHPNFQNQDYKSILEGDPLFIDLTGKVYKFHKSMIMFEKEINPNNIAEGELCLAFINEAAYYEKQIAAVVFQKIIIEPRLTVSTR